LPHCEINLKGSFPSRRRRVGTENGRENLKLVSKIKFEQMEHEFPFGTFRPEKQDYLFRRFVAPGNFPLQRPEKLCTLHFPTGISGKFL